MKTFNRNLLAACAAMVASSFVFAADAPEKPREPRLDDYKVLWEQNMFLKDRRKKDTTIPRGGGGNSADGSGPNGGRRAVETLFALRGVVFEEGVNYAYFEDMTTAKMLRLKVGESIAKGQIAEIEIDAVAYNAGGEITWVNVGTDLRGKPAALLASPSYETRATPTTTSTASTTPAVTADGSGGAATDAGGTGATTAADPATMSIEEKMRLRRLQGK